MAKKQKCALCSEEFTEGYDNNFCSEECFDEAYGPDGGELEDE